MSNSNNHIKKQNSNVRNRQIENSIAKEIAMLRREGEYLYRSINVKKKLLIVLPIITGILAFMCLGLCQPDGYTDMGILGIAIIFFIATFALGFYAYYWWNYKLEFDPAYDTMEEFAERYMKGEMIAFVNMPQIEQEILSQYQEFLNDYQTNGINIKDIGDMLYVWKDDRYLYITESSREHAITLINRYVDSSYNISSIRDDEGNYDVDCFCLPIKNIKYYAKEGDVKYTTQISGGGGGGFSMSGAIVGGLIAGDVGAIIGSRKPVEGIRSYTNEHDTRKTILKYYNGREFVSQTYPAEMYDALEEIIPEKEFNVVQLDVASPKRNQNICGDIKQRIQKLQELKEEGLITEKEYNMKKGELLTDI